MAPEAAAEGYYVTSCCGDANGVRGGYSRTSSPDPNVFYHQGHEDTRAWKDSRCGGSQYRSWPTPGGFSGYASPGADAKTAAYGPPPPHYGMPPPHGVPPMHMPVHMPTLPPFGHGTAGQMVPPQPPVFGIPASRTTASRARADVAATTDTSSSNCTPRDHYTATTERHVSPQKRHSRKHEAGPRLPVVKIPETLKKYGHPCPATWFNSRGFPLRLGKPDCKHYTTKGWCAYGTLCKFNHPEGMQTPGMSYTMMPCCPGSPPPPMVSAPWMGLHYQWGGPWNQQPQSMPMQPGYQPYVCHPCLAGPCSEESGVSSRSATGGENEKATDTESDAMYN